MGLTLYKKKRNFKNTPEPLKGKGIKKKMLSFVVQRHDASHLHYDFRLEMEGVLKSWAVPKGPSMKAGEKRLAIMVEDHPFSYGKFYGEIPKGNYGAGIVEIWDYGTYEPLGKIEKSEEEKLLLAQLEKGDLKFKLKGKYLNGAFALVKIKDGKEKNWLLIKKNDDYAETEFEISNMDPVKPFGRKKKSSKIPTPSKKEGQRAQEERAERTWAHLQKPMLAKLVASIQDDTSFIYEPKFDGYRAMTMIGNGKTEMLSRNGHNFNKQYHELILELDKIKDEIILDGEVVIEDRNGISNFQLLQNYSTTHEGILKYYVFDLLFLNGYSLTNLPLYQRKELLVSFFKGYRFKNIILSPVVVGKGQALLKKLTSKGYEGIIAKDRESIYFPGRRSDSWLKIKSEMTQEAIICGYTLPQKSRKYFGSLILGVYEGKELKYVGNCGTGFTEVSLEQLHREFKKLEIASSPFAKKPVMFGSKGKPVWMKPVLVCNVKFLEWTEDQHLRHPVFMGLRNDKKPQEVFNEELMMKRKENKLGKEESEKKNNILTIGGNEIKCTNLNKVYWPKENLTKGDLIAYYRSISKYILPYLKNRPQSLNRHPNGIEGESFYQKDMDVKQIPKWVRTEKMYSKSNKKYVDYLICNNEATLVYMANLGCIEINPWHSTYDNPDYPSYMMLDLDPGKIPFKEVVTTALVIKEICDELTIDCFCKTSGATGLHVYIPLGAKYHYDKIKTFAELVATLTHKRIPKITSIERIVAKRGNTIYVDFLQNRKGQTIAAPYSVRPKPGATVSTPLLWKEVNEQLDPQQFTIHNTTRRLNKVGDLWKEVLSKSNSLNVEKSVAKIEKMM